MQEETISSQQVLVDIHEDKAVQ